MDVTKGREVLPANVKPKHYDLTLEPNLETFDYEGTVHIEYELLYGEWCLPCTRSRTVAELL